MPYVLTVDQIDSRLAPDRITEVLRRLRRFPVRLSFTRTVGDEFQGLLTDPVSVLGSMLVLMRDACWHIGLGIGAVETPLPADDPRSARGEAFLAARAAVDTAKAEPSHLSVVAPRAEVAGADLQAVLRLVGVLGARRSAEGWAAVDAVRTGRTQDEAADALGISRQAVSQRLRAAHWQEEEETLPTLERMLRRTEAAAR